MATVSHQGTRLEKQQQQQQQLQQQEEQDQEPLRLPPLFRLDRFVGSTPDSIWKTPGDGASDGESGGARENKRREADDAGVGEKGGEAGTWLLDPGDGASAKRAEFPPTELFTARNFSVRLPRRKGKRRKGERGEDADGGGKTDPGTVQGGSVGQDSWVLPVTGDGFPMTPYQDVIEAGEKNVDSPYRSRGAGENLYRCAMGYAAFAGVTGGLGKPVYVVTSDVDRAEDVPQGTLRWGRSNYPEGVIIRFNSSMLIKLEKRLLLQSHVTIDGRGANVIIRGGMFLQNITNVIIHNVAIGDQRGDHDVVHIAGTTRVWVDHCQVYKAMRGTVDAVYGSTDITISNSYISNRNLTMLLGAEDDGEYDVANSLYSKWSYYCLGGRMYAAIRSDRNIFIARDARKELTPWFVERALWTEGFDTTSVIRSFGDLLVNGATFTEFNADLSIFDPPYRLPMHTADRELVHFIRVNAGPRNEYVPELPCTPQTCFQ